MLRNKVFKILWALSLVLLLALLSWSQEDRVIKSLNLQNADIHSVLSFLADYGNVNIVSAPTVQANVTLNLSDVTWRQALDIVVKTYRLAAVEERGYIRILPLDEYIDEQAKIEKRKAEQKALIGVETEVIDVKHASAKDLAKPLKSLLSERGTIDVVERTNTLIVKDIPENIKRARELVAELDIETDQIRISAQLLEVETSSLLELGVNWSTFGRGLLNIPSLTDSGSFTQTADKVSEPVGRFTFGAFKTDFNLNAQLSMLMQNKKAKLVAHPEITTQDNREATIQLGQKVPVKQFDQSGNTVVAFYDVGTLLRVTPHITSENRILMSLRPERSTYTFDPNGVIINTANAQTNVVVENGQTVVIGGLTTQDEEKTSTGIPILKDIPLLGVLFRHTLKSVKSTDLVIFVTPTIVTSEMHSMKESE